jgi:hypothetical protein
MKIYSENEESSDYNCNKRNRDLLTRIFSRINHFEKKIVKHDQAVHFPIISY